MLNTTNGAYALMLAQFHTFLIFALSCFREERTWLFHFGLPGKRSWAQSHFRQLLRDLRQYILQGMQ